MKTILLEVADNSYSSLLGFIQTLPKNECRVIDDNDDVLSPSEAAHIQKLMNKIDNGDYSEFEDWETVKASL